MRQVGLSPICRVHVEDATDRPHLLGRVRVGAVGFRVLRSTLEHLGTQMRCSAWASFGGNRTGLANYDGSWVKAASSVIQYMELWILRLDACWTLSDEGASLLSPVCNASYIVAGTPW